jgi:hypothetical protein
MGETGVGCTMALRAAFPWRGKARVALGGGARPAVAASPALVQEEEEGGNWARWAKRPSRSVGLLGRLGRKLGKIPFGIKIRNLNYSRL